MQRDGGLTWRRLSVVTEMRAAASTFVRGRFLLGILTRRCVYALGTYCAARMVVLAARQPLLRGTS